MVQPNLVLVYVDDWAWNGSDRPLDPNTPTLANTLTSPGCATGMIGKWHLRNDERIDLALSGPQPLRLETSHSANTYRINWFTFE